MSFPPLTPLTTNDVKNARDDYTKRLQKDCQPVLDLYRKQMQKQWSSCKDKTLDNFRYKNPSYKTTPQTCIISNNRYATDLELKCQNVLRAQLPLRTNVTTLDRTDEYSSTDAYYMTVDFSQAVMPLGSSMIRGRAHNPQKPSSTSLRTLSGHVFRP
jgi:hypothetical protein